MRLSLKFSAYPSKKTARDLYCYLKSSYRQNLTDLNWMDESNSRDLTRKDLSVCFNLNRRGMDLPRIHIYIKGSDYVGILIMEAYNRSPFEPIVFKNEGKI